MVECGEEAGKVAPGRRTIMVAIWDLGGNECHPGAQRSGSSSRAVCQSQASPHGAGPGR
jgi:hypothetical protein